MNFYEFHRYGIPCRNIGNNCASSSWKAFNSFNFVRHLWLSIAWNITNSQVWFLYCLNAPFFCTQNFFYLAQKNSSFGHEKLLKDVGKIICWGRRTGIDFLAKDNISCPGQVWFCPRQKILCKKLFQFFKLQRLLLQWLATYGSKCHWSRK